MSDERQRAEALLGKSVGQAGPAEMSVFDPEGIPDPFVETAPIGYSSGRRTAQPASSRVSEPDTPGPARILVVEDQDDVRRLLVTALEIDGHCVESASTAQGGLEQLQRQPYDLVLTDYAMPGGTGTWMLHEATRLGLMTDTVALIVTAHPDVRDLSDIEVITKPLDLDFFLGQVRRLVRAQRGRREANAQAGSRQVSVPPETTG